LAPAWIESGYGLDGNNRELSSPAIAGSTSDRGYYRLPDARSLDGRATQGHKILRVISIQNPWSWQFQNACHSKKIVLRMRFWSAAAPHKSRSSRCSGTLAHPCHLRGAIPKNACRAWPRWTWLTLRKLILVGR